MNKKTFALVLVAAVLVLLVSLLIKPGARTAPDNPVTNNQVETTTAKSQPQKQIYPDVQSNSVSEPLPPGNNLQERMEELARQKGVPLNVLSNQLLAQMSNAFSQELNRTLDFFGKALDQDGSSLSGATATISCLIFPEKQFRTNVSTDINGLFELHGVTGQALTVSVAKEGYEEVPGTNVHNFVYYGVAKGFQPAPYNPVIFLLRKKEP